MKKTQKRELVNTIIKTRVSFISIAFFVLLATAGFFGISWSGEGFSDSIEKALTDYNFEDCSIRYPYGLEDDYLDFVKKMDEVDDAEGIYQSFELFVLNDSQYQARVLSLPERVNVITEYEGHLPENDKEIAIEKYVAEELGLKIGDVISFTHNDDGTNELKKLKAIYDSDIEVLKEEDTISEDGMKYLVNDMYTISALVDSPEHLSKYSFSEGLSDNSSRIDITAYISKKAFDKEAFTGYSIVYLVSNELRAYRTDSDEYSDACTTFMEKVKEYSKPYIDEKYQTITRNKNTLLNDIKEEIENGEKELEEAKTKLENGKKQLENGKKQIAEAEKRILDGQTQVDQGYASLNEAKNKLAALESIYSETKDVIENARSIYDSELEPYQPDPTVKQKSDASLIATQYVSDSKIIKKLTNFGKKYNVKDSGIIETYISNLSSRITNGEFIEAEEEYQSICLEIDKYISDAKQEINAAANLLSTYSNELEEARLELAKAKVLLADNEKKIASATEEIKEGEEKLAEARNKYEDTCKALNEIKEYDLTIMARTANIGIITTTSTSSMLDSLKYSMSSLFVIVGALVTYTAISRLVNEQIISIGTKKALGLTEKEITRSFILYSLFACVLGISSGLIITRYLVEPGIIKILSANFIINEFIYYFSLKEMLIFSCIQIAISVISSYIASRKILKKKAVKLLSGPEEVIGKNRFYHKTWLYNRLSLLNKTIINNCFNDTRRVFSTVVGIVGCTSLLVSSMYLYNSISSSITRQKEEITMCDPYIKFDPQVEGTLDRLCQILDKLEVEYTCISSESFLIRREGGAYNLVTVKAFEDESYYNFFSLLKGDKSYVVENNAWLSEAFSSWNGIKPGDSVKLLNQSGEFDMMIENSYEYYLPSSEMTITAEIYESVFDKAYQPNTILIRNNDVSIEEIKTAVSSIDGCMSIGSFQNEVIEQCHALTSSALAIVIIFIVLSVALAVLVLLNLLTMFVEEKKKELIVMMINGYEKKDAKKYIYTDTIVLTVIGIIIGSLLGTAVGLSTIKSLDSSSTYFSRVPLIKTYLISSLATVVLSAVTTLVALRKIDRFKLTEINSK